MINIFIGVGLFVFGVIKGIFRTGIDLLKNLSECLSL
jgi:hypothetical protein